MAIAGFQPAAFVNWSFCLSSPRAALLDATRWQTSLTTKCMLWRWFLRAECPNRTRETRYMIVLVYILQSEPCSMLNPISGLCNGIDTLLYFNRLQMRSSCTKPCHTSMWWNSLIISKTKKTSIFSSSSAVGRWDMRNFQNRQLSLLLLCLHVHSLFHSGTIEAQRTQIGAGFSIKFGA